MNGASRSGLTSMAATVSNSEFTFSLEFKKNRKAASTSP